MQLDRLFDLRSEVEMLEQMRRVSESDSDMGLDPEPAPVGTASWWQAIDSGELDRHQVEGTIVSVYWASMGDWPEFEMQDESGERTRWTREGDHTRYVEGLRCRVEWVSHPWKVEHPILGTHSEVVTGVWIERSSKRSPAEAPGPGGVGLHRGS